eukprot:103532-Prymnesium_polylepis.1
MEEPWKEGVRRLRALGAARAQPPAAAQQQPAAPAPDPAANKRKAPAERGLLPFGAPPKKPAAGARVDAIAAAAAAAPAEAAAKREEDERAEGEKPSRAYADKHLLDFDEPALDGFFDPGRSRTFRQLAAWRGEALKENGREVLEVQLRPLQRL